MSEIYFNVKFIEALGYTTESFINQTLNEGLKPVFYKENEDCELALTWWSSIIQIMSIFPSLRLKECEDFGQE